MFCTKCGKQNTDDAGACASCGAPLKKRQSGIPAAPAKTELPPAQIAPQVTQIKYIQTNDEDDDYIKRFNIGAFANPNYYTLGNRIWKFAVLSICISFSPFLSVIFIRSNPSFEMIRNIFITSIIIRLIFSTYLGFTGNRLAWNTGMFTGIQQFKDMQRVWNIIGAWTIVGILLSLLFPLFGFLIPRIMYSRRAHQTSTECVDQLKKIAVGLENQIAESGNLQGILSEDEVCHYILPGFSKPEECVGMVKMKVDKVCKPGSLKVNVVGEYQYEINAITDDKPPCGVCVTESNAPEDMSGAGMCPNPSCDHE